MLQLADAGLGAVLVFLAGAAADAAGALDRAGADDRHRALAHDHVAAGVRRDATERRMVGALGQRAAGPAERRRGDRLALAAVDAGPACVVHALERDQAAAGVADRNADVDLERLRLVQRAADYLVGF